MFVTTSSFSEDARKAATNLTRKIVLIDGSQLVKLMIRYGVGCRLEETLHIKKIDDDFFDN
ncbi:MAG: restriction endonuclease [Desulfovibrio sp.]|nr:restriction endonuclease [Desulfovibrio sp.]